MINPVRQLIFLRKMAFLLLCTWASLQPVLAAQIDLQVLPDRVKMNESFRLIYTATGGVDEEPDFSALTTNFEILTNQSSSNISLINGDYSRSKTWTLDLMPRHLGNLVIPPIPFGRDMSPAKAIAVLDAAHRSNNRTDATAQAADIFIDTQLVPEKPYVQQQAVLSVKLYRAVNISSASLSEPTSASSGDLIIEKLGEDQSYPATYNGRNYRVVERRYALLPQTSGEITLNALQFDGQVASARRFGFDPFGSGRRVRVQSEPLVLNVLPIPAGFQGDQWLPAKSLTLTAQWSEAEPEFRVGEPVTRVIRLNAEGLAPSQLPEITLTLPQGVRSYRDQPLMQAQTRGDTLLAQREERIALIPEQSGILKLPAVTIPWWNTTTQTAEVARLPSVEIAVLPASTSPGNSLALDPMPLLISPDSDKPDQQGVTPINLQSSAAPATWKTSLLPWGLAGVFAAGWLITAYLWRRDRNRGQAGNLTGPRRLAHELHQACNANDRKLAAQTLLAWGKQRHAHRPPPSLEALARHEQEPLSDQINELAKAVYAQSETNWQGAALWDAVKSAKKPAAENQGADRSSLAPLNPL